MPSNPQGSIPGKHQVIIDEMMTGEAGDVNDMLQKKAGKRGVIKQGFMFNDMMKEEQSKQVVGFSDMLNEAGNQGVIFNGQGVVFGDMLKKQVGKQGVVFSLQGVFFSDMSQEQAGKPGVNGNDSVNKAEHNITQARGIAKLVRGDEFAPETIRQGGYASFVTKNSRGYVIYDGTNVQGGPHNCAWVLAWCVHSDGHGNQVYVECGAKGNITAMPDYQIYKNLDAFGSSSTYVDAKTNTDASAQIQAICTTPRLGCVFDLGGNKSCAKSSSIDQIEMRFLADDQHML
ncbi:hypothetical protein Cgig2_030846 [Carnegiea gigantea]|uniref:Uncharacterized protein n=1 Tax=Carnegiea gigantea TaxID=171969 RepID=A0A9Q1JK52_9CARY|nr:hypothetical protein Cgig2_030846 [Carnegiea gigantea]